jgi:hypothetical protein
MMYSSAWRVSYLVASPHHVWLAIWHRPVGPPRTVAVSHEWSIELALHCSPMSTRLIGHDGAACPHVLQVIMALASCALEPHEHALETREPNCIGRPAMPFFILESHGL